MASRFGRIGVLFGGYSSEREISLRSGNAVVAALTEAGHDIAAIDITTRDSNKVIEQLRHAHINIAFIALHGRLGEDGTIQSMLEDLALPYTGSRVQASQKAYDKTICQKILKQHGLPVPQHITVEDGRIIPFKDAFSALKKLPFVVKAACEGSSIGITIVRHPFGWEPGLRDALSFGPHVIIEKFIKGREFTVGILDREALPLVEIIPKTAFFDFSAKYQKGQTQYVVPAQIPIELTSRIQQVAMAAHQALACEGFSRVDVRVDESSNPYILEVNTIPGFTDTSLFPKAAKEAGYSFVDVCEKLLDLAYGKKV